jgi:hypothetical protein
LLADAGIVHRRFLSEWDTHNALYLCQTLNKHPMKNYFLHSIVITAILLGCSQKSNEHDHHDTTDPIVEEGGNQALYNEVMKIHDEVMPKMEAIYNRKGILKDSIANTPDMSEEKKKEIEDAIVKLDAASKGMEDWMHKFNPLPDSLGEEQAREYLENEMEKIKEVRSDMLEALEGSKPD